MLGVLNDLMSTHQYISMPILYNYYAFITLYISW